MRFLLHRQKPAVMATAVARRLQKEATKKTATIMPTTMVMMNHHAQEQALSKTSASPRTIRHAWGQQCSPSCGCIVRFEASIDDDSKRIESISYHAKTLVTTSKKSSAPASAPAAASVRRQEEERDEQLQVVLTSKGRPMTKACTCVAVHALCQAICSNLQQQNPKPSISTVKNMLEFQSHRSSMAFSRTVLLAQNLNPSKQQHCFDVVEEALTAVVKGYLPKPRRQKQMSPSPLRRIRHVPPPPPPLHDDDNDVDEPGFPNHAWSSSTVTSRRKETHLERKGESSTTTDHDDMRAMHVGQFFFWKKDNHEDDRVLYEDYGYDDDEEEEEEERELFHKEQQHFATAANNSTSSLSSSWRGMVNRRGTMSQQDRTSSSSTLQMFDLNLIMMMEEEEKKKKMMNLRKAAGNNNNNNHLRTKPQPPRDWVSYVDEQLYYQEQQLNCGEKAQVSA